MAVTAFEEALKLAAVAPAGIVTLAGTVSAAVLLAVSVITAPPVGAAAERVKEPLTFVPPVTEVGFSETEAIAAGLTVSVAALLTPE